MAEGRDRPDWHGRRQGRRLRPARRQLLATALPEYQLTRPPPGQGLDIGGLFPTRPRRLWLEIGFGAGEHLAGQAAANPDIGFIGCEPFVNGVAALVARLANQELGNVRVFADDARLLLPALPDAGFERVFLLFPDPWPKRRHRDRRFVGAANLAEIARLLADGGELRIATDDPGYVRWTLAALANHPDFDWLANGPLDWRQPPADWIPTRYQRKTEAAGRQPVFLRFVRRPRSPAGTKTLAAGAAIAV